MTTRGAARISIPLWLLLLAVAGCRIVPIMDVDVGLAAPQGVTIDEVGQAVMQAASELGWNVEAKEAGSAKATLRLRKHVAVVDIHYGTRSLRIDYVRSENLMASGNEIHRNYNNWVKNLSVRIQSKVAKL